jgi:hypothetical protein
LGYFFGDLVLRLNIICLIIKLDPKKMKNLFKFGFVALAISLSVAACSSNKSEGASDSTAVDSAAVDTSLATDTAAVDTAAADTAAAATTDSAAAPAAH